jgi:superfamily I DNA and/or RNA helicase
MQSVSAATVSKISEVTKFQVVAATCASVGDLVACSLTSGTNLPERLLICVLVTNNVCTIGSFDYVFIDEAGHGTEPDLWIALSGVLGSVTQVFDRSLLDLHF